MTFQYMKDTLQEICQTIWALSGEWIEASIEQHGVEPWWNAGICSQLGGQSVTGICSRLQ